VAKRDSTARRSGAKLDRCTGMPEAHIAE